MSWGDGWRTKLALAHSGKSGSEAAVERLGRMLGPMGRKCVWDALAALPLPVRRQALFIAYHNRIGHFGKPRTFNEKVNWRIINDRRDLLVWTCDKLLIKSMAHQYAISVPETLWSGVDVEALPFDDLPASWVLKPNNCSGFVLFGSRHSPGREVIRAVADVWKNDRSAMQKGEWAYTRAEPGFLLEERIGSSRETPNDYKVYVFDGEPYMILVDVDRFSNHCSRFYSPDWRPMPFRDRVPVSEEVAKPDCLNAMLEVARIVAAGFDFLRVDFYIEQEHAYLGEVTPYPGGGLEPFEPRRADFELGKAWRLPQLGGA
jgi:hypothetical protein